MVSSRRVHATARGAYRVARDLDTPASDLVGTRLRHSSVRHTIRLDPTTFSDEPPRLMRRYLIGSSISVLLAAGLRAQAPTRPTPVDSQLFRGMEWRTIGPN